MNKQFNQVEALAISLHQQVVAILVHYSGGQNNLIFSPTYKALLKESQSTLTLTQLAKKNYLEQTLSNTHKIPPVLSNLLPEGALREWVAHEVGVHTDNEFALLSWLGLHLTGAIIASPIAKGDIPEWALQNPQKIAPTQIDVRYHAEHKFSLAGVQLKFSATQNKDGRFNINQDEDTQSWIIKTPSTIHPHLPSNEYSIMRLAESVGIDIPEIKLVPLSKLNNLPNIQLPNEEFAFAINRFDRSESGRVHTEDFAQIFQYYPIDKYQRANYEEIGAVLRRFSAEPLADIQQFARRLLVNILLSNGDAHLKNWSVIYYDKQTPRLSPAYDIVFTPPYIQGEDKLALNMAKTKDWHRINFNTFKIWASRTETPWPVIKAHLLDLINLARKNWPEQLNQLPMSDVHKQQLREHWLRLHDDFKIQS